MTRLGEDQGCNLMNLICLNLRMDMWQFMEELKIPG